MLTKIRYSLFSLCLLGSIALLYTAAGRRGKVDSLLPFVTSAPRGKNIGLSISVPGEFQPVKLYNQAPIKEFQSRDEPRSEKIILQKGTVASGAARAQLAKVKASAAAGGSIIEETVRPVDNYTVTTLIATQLSGGQPELIATYLYTGPSAFAGLQYSISLQRLSQDEAVAKVKHFVANNVSVQHY